MKIKLFFCLCLLLGFTMTQLSGRSGQKNGGDTRTISYNVVWPIYILVENNGEVLEEILGSIEYHVREHYVDGELKWLKASCQGELTNDLTGEVFWINELNKSISPFDVWGGYFWVRDNIKGTLGSHYILQSLWNLDTGDLIQAKLIIPGK